MEKKQIKKLRLNKKTLRNLDDQEVQKAVGGITGTIVCSACSIACSECTDFCSVCIVCP